MPPMGARVSKEKLVIVVDLANIDVEGLTVYDVWNFVEYLCAAIAVDCNEVCSAGSSLCDSIDDVLLGVIADGVDVSTVPEGGLDELLAAICQVDTVECH